jgi:hypothetical protein
LRLTSSLNLPAPGRRQTLYVSSSDSQSPVFLVNSRYPLLSATPARSGSESLHEPRHTFSRSYGVNLPSSLTRVLSSALAFSAHLPVSVCGTVTRPTPYEAFLGSMGSLTCEPYGYRHHLSAFGMAARICLRHPPTGLNRDIQHPAQLPFSVPPSVERSSSGTGILTRFPSPTAFALGLGAD